MAQVFTATGLDTDGITLTFDKPVKAVVVRETGGANAILTNIVNLHGAGFASTPASGSQEFEDPAGIKTVTIKAAAATVNYHVFATKGM